jgi:hypothetical protein
LRKQRFLNTVLALGLVTGLFAGVFSGTALASPGDPGQNWLFFPFVYNATNIGTTANPITVTGSITIQNIEDSQVNIQVWDASGTTQLNTTKTLNPRASITYSAASLGLTDGGEGVTVSAVWTSLADRFDLGLCARNTDTLTHLKAAGTDTGTNTDAIGLSGTVVTTNDPATGVPYVNGVDYTATINGSGKVVVKWLGSGHEPAVADPAANPPVTGQYNVQYYTDCGVPRIAGVEKHWTTSDPSTTVDGYTAVPLSDLVDASDNGFSWPELDLNNQYRWVLPIAQTNTGWDSILRITNVDSQDALVNAYWYQAGTGVTSTPISIPVPTIPSGGTAVLDLTAMGYADGMVGSVWIDSDVATVALVDRVKVSTDMALTNVAQPRTDEVSFGILGNGEARLRYASLVFGGANGWNTGFDIANLSSSDNNVTITFYDNQGSPATQPTSVYIPARGMKYVYRPNLANLGFDPAQPVTAIIRGTAPIAAVVDEVKYLAAGGNDAGHAMSYAAQQAAPASVAIDLTSSLNQAAGYGKYFYLSALSLPLYQQGMNANGPNSGMNLFNPSDSSVWAMVQIVDSSGIGAPGYVNANDAELPSPMLLSPFQSTNVYAPFLGQLPSGSYSAVVGIVSKSIVHALLGAGSLVGVSNNVNYNVAGDGSAAFNMTPTIFDITDVPGFINQLNIFQLLTAGYCGFIPQNLAQQVFISDGPCLYINPNQVPFP